MKMFFSALMVGLLLLTGCTDTLTGTLDEEPATIVTADDAMAKKGIKMVPYKGTSLGYATAPPTPSDECPDEGTVLSRAAGTGQANHVGAFTWTSQHCYNPATFTFYDGWVVMTAPNGDELYIAYEGQVVGPGLWISQETISGGTGRFANARGWAVEYGMVLEDGGWSITYEGMISSVGSSK